MWTLYIFLPVRDSDTVHIVRKLLQIDLGRQTNFRHVSRCGPPYFHIRWLCCKQCKKTKVALCGVQNSKKGDEFRSRYQMYHDRLPKALTQGLKEENRDTCMYKYLSRGICSVRCFGTLCTLCAILWTSCVLCTLVVKRLKTLFSVRVHYIYALLLDIWRPVRSQRSKEERKTLRGSSE